MNSCSPILKTLERSFLLLFLFVGTCLAEPALLQPNDRVAWVGDSITLGGSHVGIVEQYFYAVHPDWKIHFFLSGWAGETASAAFNRLDRDILPEKPTVAIIHYGMNDGGYAAKDEDRIIRYCDALQGIVRKFKQAGVRVILIGPTCVDTDRRPELEKVDYNQTLLALNDAASRVAEQEEIPFLTLHSSLEAYQTKLKAQNPQATILPDGVHPGNEGGMVMAEAILTQLGEKRLPDWGVIDVETGRGTGVKLDKQTGKIWHFTTTLPSPPAFLVSPDDEALAKRAGLAETFAGRKLTVTRLPNGPYKILLDDFPVTNATALELSQGVIFPDWSNTPARSMMEMIRRKDENYHVHWKDVRIFYSGIPGAVKAMGGLMEVDEGYHQLLLNIPAHKPVITLISESETR